MCMHVWLSDIVIQFILIFNISVTRNVSFMFGILCTELLLFDRVFS